MDTRTRAARRRTVAKIFRTLDRIIAAAKVAERERERLERLLAREATNASR